MRLDDYQLHPARTPDRCPACGARSRPDHRCDSCGYASSRALWRREIDDRAWTLRALVTLASPAVVLLASLVLALISRSSLSSGVALFATVATTVVYVRFHRAQRWLVDALCVRWVYEDSRAAVSARGPGPVIEGVPIARYTRPTGDAVELATGPATIEEARRAMLDWTAGDASFAKAIERLYAAGAIRVFARRFVDRLAPIDSSFPVSGLFSHTRFSVARGGSTPAALDEMESQVLAIVDARSTHVPPQAALYRSLDGGPMPLTISLRELYASCAAPASD